MNRINQRGMDLIQYKCELMKEYPKIVKDSLYLALEQMVENKVLDMDTYMFIREDSTTATSFEEYLYSKTNFLKTEEEIFAEFEIIRSKLNDKLASHGLDMLHSESVVDKEVILVTKKFCVNEEFTMNYFGVEEKDLLKLMKRRGFVEKFAILRLTAIFKPFMETLDFPKDLFIYDMSLVYYDKDENGYSIDLYFELPVEEVEREEKLDEICEGMSVVVEKTQAHFDAKTIA
ncbi:hypothetical protein JOD82_001698 [Paenibacillus sp. 1182]|uniref:hypothetical protein n=1 Tax=Paenibacillus sp. 1182 TaxID=2806565 RepID=UPI001AEB15EE|nr:hypothetical protein [Paenibacillus sp. 1182]MBP1308678.1 hypothetical protein [Paenibacillus sp. 1182]